MIGVLGHQAPRNGNRRVVGCCRPQNDFKVRVILFKDGAQPGFRVVAVSGHGPKHGNRRKVTQEDDSGFAISRSRDDR